MYILPGVCADAMTCMWKWRGQLKGSSFLLLLCGSQGLASACEALWQVPLCTEPSRQAPLHPSPDCPALKLWGRFSSRAFLRAIRSAGAWCAFLLSWLRNSACWYCFPYVLVVSIESRGESSHFTYPQFHSATPLSCLFFSCCWWKAYLKPVALEDF